MNWYIVVENWFMKLTRNLYMIDNLTCKGVSQQMYFKHRTYKWSFDDMNLLTLIINTTSTCK